MDKGQIPGVVHQMMQGFPVYFMTTSLMCSYGEILMPDELGFREKIGQTLHDCYGILGEYHMTTQALPLKNGYSLRLRNAFYYTIDGQEGRLFTVTDPFGENVRLYHSSNCTCKELHEYY